MSVMHTGSGALSLPPHEIPESAASETAASEAKLMFGRRLISLSFFLGAENSASRRRSRELVTSVKDAGGTSRGSRKCHANGPTRRAAGYQRSRRSHETTTV